MRAIHPGRRQSLRRPLLKASRPLLFKALGRNGIPAVAESNIIRGAITGSLREVFEKPQGRGGDREYGSWKSEVAVARLSCREKS
jgi:hypothetical protein